MIVERGVSSRERGNKQHACQSWTLDLCQQEFLINRPPPVFSTAVFPLKGKVYFFSTVAINLQSPDK